MPPPQALQIDHLSVTYTSQKHTVHAVNNVSLTLDAGQFVAVCGRSGCGKSTLLLTCGGLFRPRSGTVLLGGKDLYQLGSQPRATLLREQIGFVFQQFHLVPYLNVQENILAARLGAAPRNLRQDRDDAHALAKRFELEDRLGHRPDQLSIGERQRVAMARALINKPNLLLADEPTGNLDSENTRTVLDCLAQFAAEGGTVLMVTHDAQAAQQAQRILHMDAGRMVSDNASHAATA